MERILAFSCHPDDIEFEVAGTLALLAGKGYEIHMATMTGGEAGHPTLSHQVIRPIRTREAADAAAVIGAHYHYAGGYAQNEWLAYHNEWSYVNVMKNNGVRQRRLIAVKYAEGFVQHLGNN